MMNTIDKPLIERLRAAAVANEKYEQGGGESMLLNEAADALGKSIAMLRRLEFCVNTYAQTGNDTEACPVCGAGSIVGLTATHLDGCELNALLDELSSE